MRVTGVCINNVKDTNGGLEHGKLTTNNWETSEREEEDYYKTIIINVHFDTSNDSLNICIEIQIF